MNERLKEAFDQVRAGEEVTARTRADLARQTRGYRSRVPRRAGRLAAAMACFLVMFAAAGSGWAYFTPTCAISIDLNPSLELEVNRFDKVISVEGYQEEGQALADQLDLRFLDWEEALEQVMANPLVADCLSRDQLLSITVAGGGSQGEKLLAQAQACAGAGQNVYCCAGDPEQREEAHQAGMSFGKYQAFLELQALDPQVTAEDAASMTMGELRDQIDACSHEGREDASSQGGHHGSGHRQGSGQGAGGGRHHRQSQ